MKNAVKIPLIIAGVLVLLGVLIVVLGFVLGGTGWLFRSGKYEEKTVDVSGSFDSINVETDSCDVRLALATDGKCRVEGRLQESMKLTAEVVNNTLVIKCKDSRKWYQLFNLNSLESKMTVYLPSEEFKSLKLTSASGDAAIPENFSFGTASVATASGDVEMNANVKDKLEITSASGDLKLGRIDSRADVKLQTASGDYEVKDINCGDLVISLSSGDLQASSVKASSLKINGASSEINLNDVVCSGAMTIHTASGDVNFKRCDAGSVKIDTASGDVEGSFLTGKVFTTHTASGDVRVPQDGKGGNCNIDTASGDINITIAG